VAILVLLKSSDAAYRVEKWSHLPESNWRPTGYKPAPKFEGAIYLFLWAARGDFKKKEKLSTRRPTGQFRW